MKHWQGVAVIAVIVAAVAGQWYVAGVHETAPTDEGRVTTLPVPAAPVPSLASAGAAPAAATNGESEGEGVGDGLRRVPIPPVDTRTPAWLPLAQARESGDARTPPIEHGAPAEHPDAGVLADPQAYAAHQLAQKQRLFAAYAQAAAPELARLQTDLEQGREAGIPPEELAKVAEKIRRIEQQRQAAESAK